MPCALRASGPVGGGAGTLSGRLQLHSWPQVFSPQPLWRHLWVVGAVCPWGRPPRHQRDRLSRGGGASYPLFAPQCLTTIKCQTCLFMVCTSKACLQGTSRTLVLMQKVWKCFICPFKGVFLFGCDLRYIKHLRTRSSSSSSHSLFSLLTSTKMAALLLQYSAELPEPEPVCCLSGPPAVPFLSSAQQLLSRSRLPGCDL